MAQYTFTKTKKNLSLYLLIHMVFPSVSFVKSECMNAHPALLLDTDLDDVHVFHSLDPDGTWHFRDPAAMITPMHRDLISVPGFSRETVAPEVPAVLMIAFKSSTTITAQTYVAGLSVTVSVHWGRIVSVPDWESPAVSVSIFNQYRGTVSNRRSATSKVGDGL